MIYLAGLAILLLGYGIYRSVRTAGAKHTLLDAVAAVVSGWIAGLLLGAGARVGMWAIPFFNGTESRFTLDGSIQVILIFSLLGVGLGLLYEIVFRGLLRGRGSLYGLLITLVLVYPLGSAGVEQLRFSPNLLSLAFFTFLFIAIMFFPYALLLEALLGTWHRFRDVAAPSQAVPTN